MLALLLFLLAWSSTEEVIMHMQAIFGWRIDRAKAQILNYVRERPAKKIIYFDGWDGFGASPVLNSIANELSSLKMDADAPHELRFDKVLYIDCSEWKSRREMQRAIAQELKLDNGTMAMFDNQDEEDDFNGLDEDSRDVIASIALEINRRLMDCNFMMIFLNGSDNEVDVTRFGIPQMTEFRKSRMIWTFKRKLLTIHSRRHEIAEKLRYTDLVLYASMFPIRDATMYQIGEQEFCALVHGEATTIVSRHQCMLDMDATMVTECCLFELSLHYNFHRITRLGWAAHSSNYWICAGIIEGNKKMEVANALHGEIRWECYAPLLDDLLQKFRTTFSVKKITEPLAVSTRCLVKDHWISITSQEHGLDGMQDIPAGATSVFLAFERPGHLQPSERSDHPTALEGQDCLAILPPGMFKYSTSIAVLVLSYCAFSFASPPFLMCNSLRFLGLDKCKHKPSEQYCDTDAEWAFLLTLWVLEIRYTEWDEILSKKKMGLMSNLKELKIEGVWSWQYINQLRKILPHLYRLSITNATRIYQAETMDADDSFLDKGKLQILDLSGNREMKVVPGSLSKASSLEVLLLDGCLGLECVDAPHTLPPSLISFSLDGCGAASHWTPASNLLPPENLRPASTDEKDAKISRICLEGCTGLKNLFLRGLPNLVELDLSGTGIRILDFTTMVMQVACLRRLFLLGCERLVAIRWGEKNETGINRQLELLCIDTRAETGYSRPCIDHTKRSFRLQIHAILSDARLALSLSQAIRYYESDYRIVDVYFNILVTDVPIVYSGEDVQPEATTHRVYGDVPATAGDAPMQDFPPAPTRDLDRHVEFAQVSRGLDSEQRRYDLGPSNLARTIVLYADSLHLHDISTDFNMPTTSDWIVLRQCRVERCPKLDTLFPGTAGFDTLETIWASDLLMARCIWGNGPGFSTFEELRHLNLRACPRLRFVLPVWVPSFPSLETLHITDCTDLRHVFVVNEVRPVAPVAFPNLTAIHLHNLPSLRQICEAHMLMVAPALTTIKIRGCWSLRRLPSMEGRGIHTEKPTVEIEKDVWDALEWDGVEAGHHPSLFQQPRHSRYYRKKSLRGSVLR